MHNTLCSGPAAKFSIMSNAQESRKICIISVSFSVVELTLENLQIASKYDDNNWQLQFIHTYCI